MQGSFAVGGVAANVARVKAFYRIAALAKADLVVFSEMTVPGYPPEDLLLSKSFQKRCIEALRECTEMTSAGGPAMLIGSIGREARPEADADGAALHNAMFLLEGGKIMAQQNKRNLPNYGIFDEPRYFAAGTVPAPMSWRGVNLGVLICEEMWSSDLAQALKQQGAELLIAVNASPFEIGKPEMREKVAARRVRETALPLLYVNQVGGHDEWIFDGNGFALDADARACLRMPGFREDFRLLRLEKRGETWCAVAGEVTSRPPDLELAYNALVLGLRDFVLKNGYAGVLLGLSGGIDSALAAAIAVDALGSEQVRALMLPSPYTSQESLEDARECARRLGIRLDSISIEPGMQAYAAMMAPMFGGEMPELVIGNNQPRLRAAILMELSRVERRLLLNTGNKSEMAVGYTTLYGDMCGHYAVLKDVYKTMVYQLAAWRNARQEVIPQHIIARAPTAELLPGQADQDTLPPYELLDRILEQLVERRCGVEETIAQGFEREVVEYVAAMLHAAEHKRRQSAPGPKIGAMSFWRDRRYPISNGWYVEQLQRFDGAALARVLDERKR